MCLLVFAWQPETQQPLLLLANRDEFLSRPSAGLAWWEDAPDVVAGRDLEANGTWLGVNRSGQFAALTNIRDTQLAQGAVSRGHLVSDFLRGAVQPERYIQQVAEQVGLYSGFNLLVGNRHALWFLNSQQGSAQKLSPGIYALCNADLDTPWPKVVRLRTAFSHIYNRASDDELMALMQDPIRQADEYLPDTGIGLPGERMLSSIFIQGATYGTRASTLLRVGQSEVSIQEQGFAEHAQPLAFARYSWSL